MIEFTAEDKTIFNNWKNTGYVSWELSHERDTILTREFIKTLTPEEIKSFFEIGKRNLIKVTKDTYKPLQEKMKQFTKQVAKLLNLTPTTSDEKETIRDMFQSIYDLDNAQLQPLLLPKSNELQLQAILNVVFQNYSYSIPYGRSRTIETNHNAKVLHAVYNIFGGCAIIKTKRKIIGVKLETGGRNTATPITIKEALNLLEALHHNPLHQHNLDTHELQLLKEKVEMDEVVEKI